MPLKTHIDVTMTALWNSLPVLKPSLRTFITLETLQPRALKRSPPNLANDPPASRWTPLPPTLPWESDTTQQTGVGHVSHRGRCQQTNRSLHATPWNDTEGGFGWHQKSLWTSVCWRDNQPSNRSSNTTAASWGIPRWSLSGRSWVLRAAGEGLGLGLARSGCSKAGKWGCLTG